MGFMAEVTEERARKDDKAKAVSALRDKGVGPEEIARILGPEAVREYVSSSGGWDLHWATRVDGGW